MVNPYFTKKQEVNFTITEQAKHLLRLVYLEQKQEGEDGEGEGNKIKVSRLISKMAFYYEKIRNSVDYHEEYLLRKNAIERILKREIVIQGSIKMPTSQEIAHHLLVELIRAAYLPNNKIPETKIDEVAKVIKKYLRLRDYSLSHTDPKAYLKVGDVNSANKELKLRQEMTNWILAIAASDIEERLGRDAVNEAIAAYMYEVLSRNIVLPDDYSYHKDLKIQIYIGIFRNFFKYDDEMLSFLLFKYFVPQWEETDEDSIKKIARSLDSTKAAIAEQLNHPLKGQLNRIISKYTVFFSILLEAIKQDPEDLYTILSSDQGSLAKVIREVCARRYRDAKVKLWRAAIRSIIYIFITKSIFAFMLEVPASKFFGQPVNPISLGINVTFPALLLFLVVLFTKKPDSANTNRIIEGIKEIVFVEAARSEPIKLRRPAKRSKAKNFIFGIIYAITFFVSFGFVVWVLDKIHFNWVSIIIFIFFLAFVSFFSIRIRRRIRELMVIEPKENIFTLLSDFFYTPIVASGKWLSEKFSRINVFVFVLDFIIEAPFKLFIDIAEEWTRYVKERRDEIV